MRIGTNELLIILVVALLIFGPKNLPKLGKMFGKTINGFKKGMEDEEGSDDSCLHLGRLARKMYYGEKTRIETQNGKILC